MAVPRRKKLTPTIPPPKVFDARSTGAITGLGERTIWQMASDGDFPAPIRIGRRKKGWLASEVDAWIQERIRERDEKQNAA